MCVRPQNLVLKKATPLACNILKLRQIDSTLYEQCLAILNPIRSGCRLQLSHQDNDGVTERLAMAKAFFYRQRLDPEFIKNGISNLLAGYPILAGRLGKTAGTGQPCIWLNNAGVHFRHLHSSSLRKYIEANSMSTNSTQGTALPNWTEVTGAKHSSKVLLCCTLV